MVGDRLIFGVLGPLLVRYPQDTASRGNKRETVLAALLLEANRVVSIEQLVAAVWTNPPRSAQANVQTYISGLRATLPATADGPRIRTIRGGYSISVAVDELDLLLFERLAADAIELSRGGRPREALSALDQALDLWRGDPLNDLPIAAWWLPHLDRIAARRREAVEHRLRLRIALDLHDPAITELRALLAEDPFQERLWRYLLVALNASGQQAAALAAFREARDVMVAELGIEPGAELRRTHETILHGGRPVLSVVSDGDRPLAGDGPTGELLVTGDRASGGRPGVGDRRESSPRPDDEGGPAADRSDRPAEGWASRLVIAAPGGPEPTGHRPIRQLPRDVADFTGRDREVATLVDELGQTGTGCPVAVVVGPPGVGKSALAIRVGHLLADRFPDGQLYVDLTDGSAVPPAPDEVLVDVLRSLGTPEPAQPGRTGGRAALYRSLLAGRRVLVIVDGATSADQVLPLVPAGTGCAVLVTSRRRLPELPDARELSLGVFSQPEARDLLTRLVGVERASREPSAVSEIVDACGRHPLAVRIAGIRLAGRPPWPLRTLADRLGPDRGRLDELRAGALTVREGFADSVRALPDDAVAVLRLSGDLDAEELPGWVAEPMLGTDRAAAALDTLVDSGLMRVSGPDPAGQSRYHVPRLLRCYVRETDGAGLAGIGAAAGREWSGREGREEALTRTMAAWLALAERAAAKLPVCVFRAPVGAAPRWWPDYQAADRLTADPLAWFDAERGTLLDVIEAAGTAGRDEIAWELAATLVTYQDHRGRYDDWRRSHDSALRAVQLHDNLRGEAALLRGLGQVALYQDGYETAYQAIDRSRQLSRHLGDTAAEAVAISGLGTVQRVIGRYDVALRHYQRALKVFHDTENHAAEAQACNSIGTVYREQHAFDTAHDWFIRAARLSHSTGDQHRLAIVLGQLGELQLAGGDQRRAARTLRQAVHMLDELEDERCAACALLPLARALAGLSERKPAAAALERAVEVFRRLGDRQNEARAAQELGLLHRDGDDQLTAQRLLRRAEQLRREVRPAAIRLADRARLSGESRR